MKPLILLSCVFMFWNCNERAEDNEGSSTANKDSTQYSDSIPQTRTIRPDSGLYGIQLRDATLSLQQWDSTINLSQHLGKPLKQRTKQLDQNSDTFAGSFIKDLEFDGLKLKLFSPPQNGRTFWIQEIILTNSKYKTTRGIGIGDDFDKVKQAYPVLQKFPGENENMYYVADSGYEKNIEMEFVKNKLKKLRMYYMLN